MSEYTQGLYIAQLSEKRQQALEQELYMIGLERHEIDHAMNLRIIDIMHLTDVTSVLQSN